MNPLLVEPETCLGCGFEVEATGYYRRGENRVGYICTCGAMVVDNIVIGFAPPGR